MGKKSVNQEYSVATEGGEIKEGTRGGRIASIAVNIFFGFSILLSLSLVTFSIIFFLSVVEGPSMMTKINAHYQTDRYLMDSVLASRFSEPRYGDIIIIKYYWNQDNWKERDRWNKAVLSDEAGKYEHFIKRLIAVEGDEIKFLRRDIPGSVSIYDVYRNGELLQEQYLDPHWGQIAYWEDPYLGFKTVSDHRGYVSLELTVPEGKVFFMGDNRGSTNRDDFGIHSYDCRAFGPQPRANIIGTVSDIIQGEETMPEYILRKIGEFFTFGN